MNQTLTVTALAIQAGVPTLWWGEPGTGKSAVQAALAQALNRHVEVVIASIREPSDFGGLPAIIDKSVKLVPPVWAQRVMEMAQAGRKSIVFFDEISTAAPAVQAGLLRVILDRCVGDTQLPADTAMTAAANPTESAAGGWDLTAPLANRFWHGQWTLNVSAWVDGLLMGFPAPEVTVLKDGWDAVEPLTRANVGAFVRHRQSLALNRPESGSDIGRAWPSPRTWTMAARLMAAAKAAGHDDLSDVMMHSVAGCVGPGAATEFLAWLKDADLPDPEEILKNPTKFKLPSRSDRQFAVLASVVAAVTANLTPDRWTACWKVLGKAATDGPRDVAASASATLLRLFKKHSTLPLPHDEIRAFKPMLQAAGALPQDPK